MTSQERTITAIPRGTSRRIWLERLRRAQLRVTHLAEAAALLVVMLIFACLPLDWASGFGGFVGRIVGPRLRLSRRALRNLGRAMPENSEAENRRILRGMWVT